MHEHLRTRRCGQAGAALAMALCVLIVLMLLGASVARLALQGEKAARGERDRQIAFQAAEEALMDAENDLQGSIAFPGRSAMFAPDSALGFTDGCGAGAVNPHLGLCSQAEAGAAPAWISVDFEDESAATTRSVPFGKFTGADMQTGQGFQPFRRPRYVIELVPYTQAGEDAGQHLSYFYRVTAMGFGARADSQVVLQTYYRKRRAGGGAN